MLSGVWWIEEDNVPGLSGVRLLRNEPTQVVQRLRLNDITFAALNAAKFEVRFDQRAHRSGTIDEGSMGRPARDGFDTDGS